MVHKEGNPQYTPEEIVEFEYQRQINLSRALREGDVTYTLGEKHPHTPILLFSERLKEGAKLEMEIEFQRRKIESNKPQPQIPPKK